MPTNPLSPAEFSRLFSEHARTLWCVAAAVLGRRDSAEDVLQESGIVGLQKRADFTPGTSFVHWMSQIVRFTALNEARRRNLRRAAPIESGIDPLDHRQDPSLAALEASEPFDDQTRDALATLDETARACLLMRTVLDMPYRQISEVLQIAEGTAMSHVHRSRQRVRAVLLASRHATHRVTGEGA